jgi:hypothetical protein
MQCSVLRPVARLAIMKLQKTPNCSSSKLQKRARHLLLRPAPTLLPQRLVHQRHPPLRPLQPYQQPRTSERPVQELPGRARWPGSPC